MTRRALGYLRQSIDDEQGIERQHEDVTGLVLERDWDLVGVRADNDLGGFTGRRRPGFEAVLDAVEAGEVDNLVATEWPRLGRETPANRVRLLEACVKHKTVITLVRGAEIDPSTPTGFLLAEQLGAIARFESALKAERQRRSIRQAVQQGQRVSGRRPFGFEPDGVTVREAEAAAVKAAYDAFLAGVPLVELARGWNDAGFRTGQRARTGPRNGELGLWTGDTVRGVLASCRYAGLRGHGSAPEHGRRKVTTMTPAVWPALVAEETWRAVQAKLDAAPGRGRAPKPRMLLTGVADCGVCGAPVWGGRVAAGYPIYRCRAARGHIGRRAAPVDDFIASVVVARLCEPDVADLLVDHDRPDAKALRARRVELRARLDGLAKLYADGVLTETGVRQQSEKLRAELARIEALQVDSGRVDTLRPLVDAEDVKAVWDGLGTARQRAVVDILMHVILRPPGRGSRNFDPASVRIEWKGGPG